MRQADLADGDAPYFAAHADLDTNPSHGLVDVRLTPQELSRIEVLVTSTEPYRLIGNLNQSPFNVGVNIEVVDFTLKTVDVALDARCEFVELRWIDQDTRPLEFRQQRRERRGGCARAPLGTRCARGEHGCRTARCRAAPCWYV